MRRRRLTTRSVDAPTSIKERGAFDLQNFRIGAGSEATGGRRS